MLIQLNIKLHSGKIILVAFRSGAFQGTFWYQFQNAWIPPEQVTTGMAILAEPPANFHSSGMHRIPPESPESGRNLWGTDKTSPNTSWRWSISAVSMHLLLSPHHRHPRIDNSTNGWGEKLTKGKQEIEKRANKMIGRDMRDEEGKWVMGDDDLLVVVPQSSRHFLFL